MVPRVIIGGVQSGVGKTVLATGLMAALARRGYKVQGFKAGPDYIDPGYHAAATGRASRNLDGWLLPEDTMRELFLRAAARADVAVVEGVMGLFDGYDRGEAGSTARLAKCLDAPVILVVNAGGMARSAAALVQGYKNFDPAVRLRGVIFNNAGSPRHYRLLKDAVEEQCGVEAVGYLPKTPGLQLPERHLGLVPAAEQEGLTAFLDRLAGLVAASIDLDRVLAIARSAPPLDYPPKRVFAGDGPGRRVKIAVAMDEAFSFYYRDALDLLEAAGARLVYFSPLRDKALPAGVHGVYIGGGFPEMFLGALSRNRSMLDSIAAAHRRRMPIYAECGGLMYLSEGIIDFAGRFYPMAGLVPGRVRMQEKRAALGYATAEVLQDNILASRGAVLRGHQFRWSVLTGVPPGTGRAYRLAGRNGGDAQPEGIVVGGNLLASYLHLHFAGHPALARNFVASCLAHARRVSPAGGDGLA